MRVGQARKRDANEKAIVDALRRAGATILQLSAMGAPDLLVGFRGKNWLLEVKTPRGKTRPGQRVWARWWSGQATVVKSEDEALEAIGAK